MEIMALAFLIAVISNISNTSSSILRQQLSDNIANSVVASAGSLFEASIQQFVDAGLTIVSVATGDSFRPDYSSRAVTSYFDSAGSLSNPVTIGPNERRFANQTISLAHSSWTIANDLSTTPPILSADLATTRDATAHVDSFTRNIYAQTSAMIFIYMGFENGFFRSYPGTGKIRLNGAYDPTSRPWYVLAKQHTPANPYVISDPYLDAQGKGWCISASTIITDGITGALRGVAGIDAVLSDLSNQLRPLSENGTQVGIFLNNAVGNVISHPQFDAVTTATSGAFTYKSLSGPVVSDSLWNSIVSSADASINTRTNSYKSATYQDPKTNTDYLVIWKTLSLTNGQNTTASVNPSWVAVGTIPIAQITGPVEDIQSEMRQTLIISSVAPVAVFLLIVVTVLRLGASVANAAVQPLIKLADDTTRISNNIGTADLFDGVGRGDSTTRNGLRQRVGRVDETEELRERFYHMVGTIRNGANIQPGTEEISSGNAFFGNNQLPEWSANTVLDSGVIDLLPDSPPRYTEFDEYHHYRHDQSLPLPPDGFKVA
ncbi:hypothetical protein HDU76_005934 [Blyttiomyces sp. JEL0837]|nr:hypothetical protein HDU76_005934 [Blyttiomyces sp. JEL0837]